MPIRPRSLAALALVPLLAVPVACGDDDASTSGAQVATTTTTSPPPTTTVATVTTVGTVAFPAGSAEAAAASAYATVFDSAVAFVDKAPHIEDAAALEETLATYAAGAAAFNGFRLDVKAVTITGNTAAVTYDLYFGAAKQYGDLPGTVENRDGTWTVTREELCGFMASARVPCA